MESKVLSFQKQNALSIVQLFTSDRNTMDYISGSKGFKIGVIEVKEINEAGSVNDILVINSSNKFAFFMDGDILTGAKQNRVLNTSVFIAPKSKTIIPVSCVEQGRWSHTSPGFREANHISPSALRAGKAKEVKRRLKTTGKHYANQGQVWQMVNEYTSLAKVDSETDNLSDVFDEKQKDFDNFLKEFKETEGANGIAVFVNRKLMNIDIFNRTDIYQEYFPKILKGAAMEAYWMKEDDQKLSEAEAIFKTVTFLDKFEDIQFETHKGVAAGNEKRFESGELTGFELEYDNHLIHLAALNLESGN